VGIGEESKIIIIILASFFPMFLNIKKGFASCDRKLLEVGKVFGLNGRQRFYKIILPSAVPDILLGMKVGLGYSWRAIIGAEMIAAASGLGYFILDAQTMSRSDKVIVGILVIGFLGVICDQIFTMVTKKITRKGGVTNSWD
jgi:sulfonate transport system permease protein